MSKTQLRYVKYALTTHSTVGFAAVATKNS